MSGNHQQAHLDAPIESIWALIGDPGRFPEWWPRVIEIRGERFEEGEEYVQVTKAPGGPGESRWLLDRYDEMRAIHMSCQMTGTYARWSLTEAQGGTFVDLEMGIQPKRLGDRLFSAAFGRSFFRRWGEESLEALQTAAQREQAASPPGA
jgi:uncharacterized protein YndB with AHSA1/START domain